jgi:hypothetical protein
MLKSVKLKRAGLFMAIIITPILLVSWRSPSPVFADSDGTLLYSYNFTGSTRTVADLATSSPYGDVPLTLRGNWSDASPTGVQFSGNTTNEKSVAYGKPTSGDTLDVPSTDALGVAAQLGFQAPSLSGCDDTPNVTQIGRDGASGAGQIKLQESNCTPGQPTYMECRVAGANDTPQDDLPLASSFKLTAGDNYNVYCVKSRDHGGTTTLTLTVEDISNPNRQVVTNTANMDAVGGVVTTAYISVGNKYKLPAQSQNTDQFNGIVDLNAYCSGDSSDAVITCLTNSVPKG